MRLTAATPFKRALAMMAALVAAMNGPNPQAAMAGIGPYESRGKGRGKAFDKQRHGNQAGKYLPHQGIEECRRRCFHRSNAGLRTAPAAYAKGPVSA